jgi:uncharacterized protein
VAVQVTAIMLAVEDLARSRKFYREGLGCTINQDHPGFVSFDLGDGSSSLALYEREAAARDAGVSAEGSGFRGVSFHYIVGSRETVDEVMSTAAAGGQVVKPAAASQWAGTPATSATSTATSGRWRPRWPRATSRRRSASSPATRRSFMSTSASSPPCGCVA